MDNLLSLNIKKQKTPKNRIHLWILLCTNIKFIIKQTHPKSTDINLRFETGFHWGTQIIKQ